MENEPREEEDKDLTHLKRVTARIRRGGRFIPEIQTALNEQEEGAQEVNENFPSKGKTKK